MQAQLKIVSLLFISFICGAAHADVAKEFVAPLHNYAELGKPRGKPIIEPCTVTAVLTERDAKGAVLSEQEVTGLPSQLAASPLVRDVWPDRSMRELRLRRQGEVFRRWHRSSDSPYAVSRIVDLKVTKVRCPAIAAEFFPKAKTELREFVTIRRSKDEAHIYADCNVEVETVLRSVDGKVQKKERKRGAARTWLDSGESCMDTLGPIGVHATLRRWNDDNTIEDVRIISASCSQMPENMVFEGATIKADDTIAWLPLAYDTEEFNDRVCVMGVRQVRNDVVVAYKSTSGSAWQQTFALAYLNAHLEGARGQKQFDKQQWALAEASFQRAISAPDAPLQWRLTLAKVLLRNQKRDEAMSVLKEAKTKAPIATLLALTEDPAFASIPPASMYSETRPAGALTTWPNTDDVYYAPSVDAFMWFDNGSASFANREGGLDAAIKAGEFFGPWECGSNLVVTKIPNSDDDFLIDKAAAKRIEKILQLVAFVPGTKAARNETTDVSDDKDKERFRFGGHLGLVATHKHIRVLSGNQVLAETNNLGWGPRDAYRFSDIIAIAGCEQREHDDVRSWLKVLRIPPGASGAAKP